MPRHAPLWINADDELMHPWAPAGGAGGGAVSLPGALCESDFVTDSGLPHPNAPAARDVSARHRVAAHRPTTASTVAAVGPWEPLLNTIEHHVDYIHVEHGHVRISPSLFRRVAAAIRNGRIIMAPGKPVSGGDCEYVWRNDGATTGKVVFGASFNIQSPHSHALFVHECVHLTSHEPQPSCG